MGEKTNLFQYMSIEKCFSILRNQGLPLRNFITYNDPFECLPEFVEYAAIQALFKSSTEEERIDIIFRYLKSTFSKYRLSEDFILGIVNGIVSTGLLKYPSIPLIGAYVVIGGITSLVANARDDNSENIDFRLELFYHKYFPLLVNSYTSCFTTSMNNLLMWSHYAQSHHGVVMEFDPTKEPFTHGTLKSIEYKKSSRFDFTIDDILDEKKISASAYSLLSTKSEVWQYENEIRLIYNIKANQENIIWRDNYNNPVVKIDISSVKCIYTGRRISESDIDTLYGILMDQGLDKKISVKRIRLSRTGYMIESY